MQFINIPFNENPSQDKNDFDKMKDNHKVPDASLTKKAIDT